MNSTPIFFRHGQEFTGTPRQDAKGKPVTYIQERCGRCGGAGGSEKWHHTGWTCYQCRGNGQGPVREHKLYTQEQLDKLNAAQAKRDAKKAAKIAEAQAQREAERSARREQFLADNTEILAIAKSLDAQIARDIVCRRLKTSGIIAKSPRGSSSPEPPRNRCESCRSSSRIRARHRARSARIYSTETARRSGS